ncbi:uncharacterized protein [Halyomorpha halys]|uniref:uncharacterized protein n=1 Tax=Halyomorpha halys TaxID=286706 RepID=UPI0006D5020D|nr:uncharacterized protein LOC106691261 [Halyomorpha halys]
MVPSAVLFVVVLAVAGVSAQAPSGMGGMGNMAGMNMNFNLSTPQGILGFLNMEGINPSSLVTQNCIANGNSCSAGGQPCCLSPVFSCQGSPGKCMVVSGHVNHLAEIRQIVQTAGVSTQNPIL